MAQKNYYPEMRPGTAELWLTPNLGGAYILSDRAWPGYENDKHYNQDTEEWETVFYPKRQHMIENNWVLVAQWKR